MTGEGAVQVSTRWRERKRIAFHLVQPACGEVRIAALEVRRCAQPDEDVSGRPQVDRVASIAQRSLEVAGRVKKRRLDTP